MYSVWIEDDDGYERYLIGGISHAAARALLRRLSGIFLNNKSWMEESWLEEE